MNIGFADSKKCPCFMSYCIYWHPCFESNILWRHLSL